MKLVLTHKYSSNPRRVELEFGEINAAWSEPFEEYYDGLILIEALTAAMPKFKEYDVAGCKMYVWKL